MEGESWYAIWTRSQHEQVVEEKLKKKGLKIFLPTVQSMSRRVDRRVMLVRPLFPGYLFFHATLNSSTKLLVLQTPGVVTILGETLLIPTPIPDQQIETIQKLISSSSTFASVPYLRIGERAQIKDGPLAGVEGIIQEYRGKTRLLISVDLLQRSVLVELEGWRLERV